MEGRCALTPLEFKDARKALRLSQNAMAEALGLTLDDDDLHDITRDKLKLFDEVKLPSGDVHRKRRSTSNRAMNEAERAEYTNKALQLWSTWTGVPVETLRSEAQ